jgi:hypothetical protein
MSLDANITSLSNLFSSGGLFRRERVITNKVCQNRFEEVGVPTF